MGKTTREKRCSEPLRVIGLICLCKIVKTNDRKWCIHHLHSLLISLALPHVSWTEHSPKLSLLTSASSVEALREETICIFIQTMEQTLQNVEKKSVTIHTSNISQICKMYMIFWCVSLVLQNLFFEGSMAVNLHWQHSFWITFCNYGKWLPHSVLAFSQAPSNTLSIKIGEHQIFCFGNHWLLFNDICYFYTHYKDLYKCPQAQGAK